MTPDDFEQIRQVLRRYSLESVPPAAITPSMALVALDRIEYACWAAERFLEALAATGDEDGAASCLRMMRKR